MIPTSNSAEWHLTYSCDLECVACTRASFLRQPPVAPMTIDDAHEFCRQARALDWIPGIVITGGEPTMHRDFLEMVAIALEFTRSTGKSAQATATASGNYVRVFSNAHTERARRLTNQAQEGGASIVYETAKLAGSVTGAGMYAGWSEDTFVSPHDLGKPLRAPCYQHASAICGVSVDHDGYSPCAPGGALGALLGVGKTRRLADLFEPAKMAELTAALCRHCGSVGLQTGVLTPAELEAQPRRFGAPMSPTWAAAFEGRR